MKYIVKQYIAVPGLHNWPQAQIIIANDHNAQQMIAKDERLARFYGENIIGYRVYDEADRAQALCDQVNATNAQSLAKWRHEVYGEPIPVSS